METVSTNTPSVEVTRLIFLPMTMFKKATFQSLILLSMKLCPQGDSTELNELENVIVSVVTESIINELHSRFISISCEFGYCESVFRFSHIWVYFAK